MKAIRREVMECLALGPVPASEIADEDLVARLTSALMEITSPVSENEAVERAAAFGPDECVGLAWTLIHLIESAPQGAPLSRISASNEWTRRLRERAGRR